MEEVEEVSMDGHTVLDAHDPAALPSFISASVATA